MTSWWWLVPVALVAVGALGARNLARRIDDGGPIPDLFTRLQALAWFGFFAAAAAGVCVGRWLP